MLLPRLMPAYQSVPVAAATAAAPPRRCVSVRQATAGTAARTRAVRRANGDQAAQIYANALQVCILCTGSLKI